MVDRRGVHLISWDIICGPKRLGWMSVQELRMRGMTFMAKWLQT